MIHASTTIQNSDSFTYKWDETAELTIRELDMPLIFGDGNGCSYKYAVGIETYGRNYCDEYVESPNLFYSLGHAKKHFNLKRRELKNRQDIRF